MDCSTLPEYLEGTLSSESRARFERHLVGCAACQRNAEADMQLTALGAQAAQRRDRPRPVLPAASRTNHRLRAAVVLSALAAVVLVWYSTPRGPESAGAIAGLGSKRLIEERLPYAALDVHRAYDTTRAGSAKRSTPREPHSRSAEPVRGEDISRTTLQRLESHPERSPLIATLIARGDIDEAASLLQKAGPGDDLDVERAIVAKRTGQPTVALALLDGVLARAPSHPQAQWNRAIVLRDLDLPGVAAEAFEVSAAGQEPGWNTEAAGYRDDLRRREARRTQSWQTVIAVANQLTGGVIPDVALVRDHASVFRPALLVAVRLAATPDDVRRLGPLARAIDEASGDTACSELLDRVAAADFEIRRPGIAIYRELRANPPAAMADKVRVLAQLRAGHQDDLVIGALVRLDMPRRGFAPELARLAHASRDPYLVEIAAEWEADARLDAGKPLEAELGLRDAVQQCTARDVELRCANLQLALARLYLARHRLIDARDVAMRALRRSRSLDLYWDEHLLFDVIAEAARFERDYPQMRAYAHEAALQTSDCPQQRMSLQITAAAAVSELRFAEARAELGRAPTCDAPFTLVRAQVEADLARFDATPERTARLRGELDRIRREVNLTPGERAQLDAIEGRLLAVGDRVAARALLERSIEAADALGVDDVAATRGRYYAYNTLLLLAAADRSGPAVLALFAGAGRAPLRPGCALGALIDGERLLLLARDPAGGFEQVFDLHAFSSPDFDASTLVPASLVTALSRCERVDVIALPPLYGQPRLLPPGIAWSYRGPAGEPPSIAPSRPAVLTIEDAHPPAALGLAKLQSSSRAPRSIEVDGRLLGGPEATPGRVRKELPRADLVEIHAHGLVDLGISDVSLIALSPDADGTFALTARVIAGLKLPRAPFVTLAACDAAYTAPYLHEPWSLPHAFLLAGARGVLAPATAIPDKDAAVFFQIVGDEILRGRDPAAVLRDQRARWRGDSAAWVNDVLLFD